jgi:hypothetical protein
LCEQLTEWMKSPGAMHLTKHWTTMDLSQDDFRIHYQDLAEIAYITVVSCKNDLLLALLGDHHHASPLLATYFDVVDRCYDVVRGLTETAIGHSMPRRMPCRLPSSAACSTRYWYHPRIVTLLTRKR